MMKRLLSIVFVTALILCLIPLGAARAVTKLDEIETYMITVDMESDGTMDITYHLDWKVLDDSSEGPLTWVKIGIPNEHVDNIKALSSNITNINYYNDGGDYVRIDLDRSCFAGEIVPLDFSIHQSYMYTLDYENNLCSYQFTPGWFEGADVKDLTILWSDNNVLNSDGQKSHSGYIWSGQHR